MSILKKGLKGAPVKRLQEKLGVAADGDFGPGTEKALKEFQKSKGLAVDGIAGPDTFTAIGLPELVLLRRGLKGAQVKKLQEALGISADGSFGPATEKAVLEFQIRNGLEVDGLAGPETLARAGVAGFTAATVAAAGVKADEEHFESETMPEMKDNAVVAASSSSGKSVDQVAAEMKDIVAQLAAGAKPAASASASAPAAPAKSADEIAAEMKATVEALAKAKPAPAPKKSVWGKVKGWF